MADNQLFPTCRHTRPEFGGTAPLVGLLSYPTDMQHQICPHCNQLIPYLELMQRAQQTQGNIPSRPVSSSLLQQAVPQDHLSGRPSFNTGTPAQSRDPRLQQSSFPTRNTASNSPSSTAAPGLPHNQHAPIHYGSLDPRLQHMGPPPLYEQVGQDTRGTSEQTSTSEPQLPC